LPDPVETPGRVDIALAVPLRAGRVLVARRTEEQHQGGLWEFPGGRIESGEEPADAARRELEEETGLRATGVEPLVVVVHDYADRPLRFHVFVAREPEGEVRLDRSREWTWVAPAELEALEMPEANRQMLRALRWRLPGSGDGPR
jgi:8-oxo-dGTP diphosphatase